MSWLSDAWDWTSSTVSSAVDVVGEVGAHAISAVAAPVLHGIEYVAGGDVIDENSPQFLQNFKHNVYRCGDNIVSGLETAGDFCVDVGTYVYNDPLDAIGRGANSAVSGIGTFVVGAGELIYNAGDYTLGAAGRAAYNACVSEENEFESAWPSQGFFELRATNAVGEALMFYDEPDPFVYEEVVGENGEIERKQIFDDVYDDQGKWVGKQARLNEHFMAQSVFHHGPRAGVEVAGAILTGGALAPRLAGTAAKLGAVTNSVITAVSSQRIANAVVNTGARVGNIAHTIAAARGRTERIIVAGASTLGAAIEVKAELDKRDIQNEVVQMGLDQAVEAADKVGDAMEEAFEEMRQQNAAVNDAIDQWLSGDEPETPEADTGTQSPSTENAPDLKGAFESTTPEGGSTGYMPDMNGAFDRSAKPGSDNAMAFNNRSLALVTPISYGEDGSMQMKLKGMTQEDFESRFAAPGVT